jgi:hypothetical protein
MSASSSNGRPLPEHLLTLVAPVSAAMLPRKLEMAEVLRPPRRIVVRRTPKPPPAPAPDREHALRLVAQALSSRPKPGRVPAGLLEGFRMWGRHLACRYLPGLTWPEAMAWAAQVLAALRAGLARLPQPISGKMMDAFKAGLRGRRP